jgi:hypothetical protein
MSKHLLLMQMYKQFIHQQQNEVNFFGQVQPVSEGPQGSGTKQWCTAKGGVYAVQPEGAWRNAAQLCKQKKQRGCSFLFARSLQRKGSAAGIFELQKHWLLAISHRL